jgi:hypothetical protein
LRTYESLSDDTVQKISKGNRGVTMLTAQKVIHEIHLLPKEEKEKLAHHITQYGGNLISQTS